MLLFSADRSTWHDVDTVWIEDDKGNRYCITPVEDGGIRMMKLHDKSSLPEKVVYVIKDVREAELR